MTNELHSLAASARTLAEIAGREDLDQRGDITTSLIDAEQPALFVLLAKQPGVFCGRAVAEPVLAVFDGGLSVSWLEGADDGAVLSGGRTELATVRGRLADILGAERTLLNFLQRTSGVATLTRRYVDAVAGTRARIYDTRKTIPGWRLLDKYAVRCGGGHNHRAGLYDAVLLKDNHLAGIETPQLAARVFEMLNRATGLDPQPAFVEVEAASLEQVRQLFRIVGIDVVLLDNFSLDELKAAVALRDSLGLAGKIELEASGGVALDTVRAVAETGVDRISVGALTHSAPALDLSLKRIDAGGAI